MARSEEEPSVASVALLNPDVLLPSALLPTPLLSKPMPVLLPSATSRTRFVQLKLNVTPMPVLLLSVKTLLTPPMPELLPTVPALPVSRPTVWKLIVTTPPSPMLTRLLVLLVVSTLPPPTLPSPTPLPLLLLLQHPAESPLLRMSMLPQGTQPSPKPTRLPLLPLVSMPMPETLLSPTPSLLLQLTFLLTTSPSPMLTKLPPPLPLLPLPSHLSVISMVSEEALEVQPASLETMLPASEVLQPPPLLSLVEEPLTGPPQDPLLPLDPLPLDQSLLEPSLPRTRV